MKRAARKRGQLFQVGVFISILLGLSFLIFIVIKVNAAFFSALDESGYTTTVPEVAALKVSSESWASYFDWGMMAVLIGLTIGLLYTSWLIPSHPIFLPINIIGIFVIALVAMGVSNAFGEAIAGADAAFETEAAQMPITVWIIQNLPYVAVIAVFLSTVIMYSKSRQAEGYA